jgi:anti-sigma B factor antagonist
VLVEVQGEIDIYTSPRLDDLLAACAGQGFVRLVVDLTDVTFVDSTALGVLVTAARRVLPHDGSLTLVCGSGHVRRTFELTGLHELLHIVPTREAALSIVGA